MSAHQLERERRKHPRTVFSPNAQPYLHVGPQVFTVTDISAGGLRLQHSERINLGGWVNGRLVFGDRDPIAIQGIVVRDQDGGCGLHFAVPLDLPLD